MPVYHLGSRAEVIQPAMWGVVFGVMGVASMQGLLAPGFRETDDAHVIAGALAGVAFLFAVRSRLGHNHPRLGSTQGPGARRGVLVFLVLFAHSLPEGLALGAAFASDTAGLSLFVFLAIAIQNVPEGTATAIPARDAGASQGRAFWLATLTSAPQPIGAVAAYLLVDAARSVLGLSFGFAAGAMLALLVVEVIPAMRGTARASWSAAAISAAVMAGLGFALDVG